MASTEETPQVRDIAAIAEADLDFVFRLRSVVDDPSSDPRVATVLLQRAKPTSQTVRRLYVRLFVSLVESVVATLKSDTLQSAGHLSSAEKVLLADAAFDVNDHGEAYEKPFFAPIQKNLKFAFQVFAKARRFSFALNLSDDGWCACQDVVRIRNRITHPRRLDEMEITDSELKRVEKAHDWFVESYRGLLSAHIQELERQLEQSKEGRA